jgi:hypothetical protein
MLVSSVEVAQHPRIVRGREEGIIPLPVKRLRLQARVFNALAEGRLTALVVGPDMLNMPGHMLAVYNQRNARTTPLELIMGRVQEDNFGLERGYRVLPVALLGLPQNLQPVDEPTKCFGTASLRRGYMFMSNAPTHLEKIGRPFLDSSTVILREPDRMVDDKSIPGTEHLTRVAVMSAFDMPGIARHAQLVTVPRAY